jgi:hypothetical protein
MKSTSFSPGGHPGIFDENDIYSIREDFPKKSTIPYYRDNITVGKMCTFSDIILELLIAPLDLTYADASE